MVCEVKVQGNTGRLKFSLCPLYSTVPISLIHFIWDTHTAHEVAMLAHHFQVKGSKVKITRVIWSFSHVRSATSSLFDHLICGIHTTREGAVYRVLFSGWKVKGQGYTGGFKFWYCPLCDLVPIWPNHFICSIHTTYQGMMCRAAFSGWKLKGQGHTGRSKFLPCPLRGFLLIWPNHFICSIHTTHERTMCRAPDFVICPLWLHAYLTGLWRLGDAAATGSLVLLVTGLIQILGYTV